MKCKNCGSLLKEGEKFCNKCGKSTVERESHPLRPVVDPSSLVVKPMSEPTNELAKLAKPEDHKEIVVRNTNPLLIIFVFLLALALGYFGYQFLNKDKGIVTSLNGYRFDVPTGLKIDHVKEHLYLNNDDILININVLQFDYTKMNAKTIDGYKYEGEKEFEGKKYQLFTKGDNKIVIMSLDSQMIILMNVNSKDGNIDKALKIMVSAKKNEEKEIIDNDQLLEDMKPIITGEEVTTADEDAIYEDTYVDIVLDELN